MIDDPALREFAITRLQNVQKKVNKGEDLDKIEAMMEDLPWNPATPKAENSLQAVKNELHAKAKINETQIELAKVAFQRQKQSEELEQTRQKLEEIKRSKSIGGQPLAIASPTAMEESEYEYEEYYGTEQDEPENSKEESSVKEKEIVDIQPTIELRLEQLKSPPAHFVQSVDFPTRPAAVTMVNSIAHGRIKEPSQAHVVDVQLLKRRSDENANCINYDAVKKTSAPPALKAIVETKPDIQPTEKQSQNKSEVPQSSEIFVQPTAAAVSHSKQAQLTQAAIRSNSEMESPLKLVPKQIKAQQIQQEKQIVSPTKLLYPRSDQKVPFQISKQSQQLESPDQPKKLYFPRQDLLNTSKKDHLKVQLPPSLQEQEPVLNPLMPFGATKPVQILELKPASQLFEMQKTAIVSNVNNKSDTSAVAALQKPHFNDNKFTNHGNQQPSMIKTDVVDMLQSLQTIQIDNEDDIVPEKAAQQQKTKDKYNLQNPYENQRSEGVSRQSMTGSYISDEQNELTDSMPAFIIKPFEESANDVEADGQTSIKAFEEDDFDFGDDEWAEQVPNQTVFYGAEKQASPQAPSNEKAGPIVTAPQFDLKAGSVIKGPVAIRKISKGWTDGGRVQKSEQKPEQKTVQQKKSVIQSDPTPQQQYQLLPQQNQLAKPSQKQEIKPEKCLQSKLAQQQQPQQQPLQKLQQQILQLEPKKQLQPQQYSQPKPQQQPKQQLQPQKKSEQRYKQTSEQEHLPQKPQQAKAEPKQQVQNQPLNPKTDTKPSQEQFQQQARSNPRHKQFKSMPAKTVLSDAQAPLQEQQQVKTHLPNKHSRQQALDLNASGISTIEKNLAKPSDENKTVVQKDVIEDKPVPQVATKPLKSSGGKLEIHSMIASHQHQQQSKPDPVPVQAQVTQPRKQKQPQTKAPSPVPEKVSQTDVKDTAAKPAESFEPLRSTQVAEYMDGGLAAESDAMEGTAYLAPFVRPQFVISRPGIAAQKAGSRNENSSSGFYLGPGPADLSVVSDRQMTQKQAKKKRRLHITRMSNPQENSVLNVSNMNTTQLNNSSVIIEPDSLKQDPFQVELSQEYINARKFFMRSSLASQQLNSSGTRSSQRILKVVNIIGSSSQNRDGNTSSKRVNNIRARQYKSKGEKVMFRHTGSRENLMSSQEIMRASGFASVKLNQIDFNQYQEDEDDAVVTQDHLNILASAENNQGLATQQARKNMMLLNKKGGGPQKPASVSIFYPSNNSCNLNHMLNEMEKEDSNVNQKEADVPNIASPSQGSAVDALVASPATTSYQSNLLVQHDLSRVGGILSRDSETPSQAVDPLQIQRQQSLNRSKEIFKRKNLSSFNTNDPLSPVQGLETPLNQSLLNGTTSNFEEAIAQQRDSHIIEKLEQQHKVSMHRKNSDSRRSIESQRRSQREESLKAKRAARRKALDQHQQQQYKTTAAAIPVPTYQRGRASTKHLLRNSQQKRQQETRRNSAVGLSDMFYGSREQQKPEGLGNATYSTTNMKYQQSDADQDTSAAAAAAKKDEDADSHFSEEW